MDDYLPCFSYPGDKKNCPGRVSKRKLAAAPPTAQVKCMVCLQSLPARVYQQTIEVVLTPEDIARCIDCGKLRQSEAVRDGRPDLHGLEGNGEEAQILGAYGEFAASIVARLPWTASVNTFKAPDVGSVQVRTRSLVGYDLIVRGMTVDYPGYPYLLVTMMLPRAFVVGWIYGSAAQEEPTWRQTYESVRGKSRPPAFFVPKTALLPPLECPFTVPVT